MLKNEIEKKIRIDSTKVNSIYRILNINDLGLLKIIVNVLDTVQGDFLLNPLKFLPSDYPRYDS